MIQQLFFIRLDLIYLIINIVVIIVIIIIVIVIIITISDKITPSSKLQGPVT